MTSERTLTEVNIYEGDYVATLAHRHDGEVPCFACHIVKLKSKLAACEQERDEAQRELIFGRGRADELSSLVNQIVQWTEADLYPHRDRAGTGWHARADVARRASELLSSTLHLKERAEAALAKLQALRPRIHEASIHGDNCAYTERLLEDLLHALPALSEQGTKA